MAFLALVDAPLSSESMKFPVFSLLTEWAMVGSAAMEADYAVMAPVRLAAS
jgi:hypothetical protein